ncbi:hypothetical protein CO731_02980 [Aminobacter sp. MSH1]|uniref:DUF1127 domain-containing protein n=1 Tax=Aminobacter niigataensis TaxID=83265 RepID=A0ABR6KWI1_9HYPH|nr:hypothetical protein [Aminobacter niigataensis]AWC23508.1 hypothetical protein CO731_02980 [Aminobacter sp. MSH1]MBB4648888.1 hypothetical protein [Aminobacter niigataensis]CAI2934178.1 conserved protein of unknown function [Aminobacter niigataensis]
MSIIGSISRYGADIRRARREARSLRRLNSLPPEIQKDIGWPAGSDEQIRALHSAFLARR